MHGPDGRHEMRSSLQFQDYARPLVSVVHFVDEHAITTLTFALHLELASSYVVFYEFNTFTDFWPSVNDFLYV